MYRNINVSDLREKAMIRMSKDFNMAIACNDYEWFIQKYHLEDEVTEYSSYEKRKAKILIVGDLACRKDIVYQIAKKYEIDKDILEFVSYEESTNYDFKKLKNTYSYSDVLVGPMAHKNNGIENCSSFIVNVEKNQENYPKLIKLQANQDSNNLKITKTALDNAFQNTRYYNDNI